MFILAGKKGGEGAWQKEQSRNAPTAEEPANAVVTHASQKQDWIPTRFILGSYARLVAARVNFGSDPVPVNGIFGADVNAGDVASASSPAQPLQLRPHH